ncbi:hypothetical protein NIES4074_36180 [Cylindrospermum sp. NIES-4074]|nr:hypothetical protein NIES4074_36180 [Cylindrospermum sp. NIES-4074]
MKIIYDSLGNPAQIFISVAEINYQLPFNPLTKEIEWQLIENEITRDLLENTWQNLNVDSKVFKNIPPSPEIELIADWEGWNIFMSNDVPYNRLIDKATNQRAVTRLEMLFVRRFFQSEMIVYWEQVINSAPLSDRPTLEEVEVWRNAVNSYNMPFNFTDTGLMEVV